MCEEKQCRICGEVKPLNEFYRRKDSRDGHRSECKVCMDVQNRHYHNAHKESIAKRCKRWRENFPEKRKLGRKRSEVNRRARLKNAEGSLKKGDIQNQLQTQRCKCWWCKREVGSNYHVDHLIPISRGGSNDKSNIVIACPKCNMSRNNKLPNEWVDRWYEYK